MGTFSNAARVIVLGLCMTFTPLGFAQQGYPNKAIRLITPYATGGSTTTVAHLVGQRLAENWGKPVVVENRPGGSTIIGSEALVRSAPDGYTIMLVSTDHAIISQLLPTPYDVIKDFTPISTLSASPLMLAAHPSLPASTLSELIALAKAKPGQINYAQTGNGTISHLMGEMLNTLAGVKIQSIPYKGGGPAMIDLIGGQVQLAYSTPLNFIPLIKGEKVKGIALTGESRMSALPQVPTFTQAGLPGLDVMFWLGIVAPAAVPRETVIKLSSEISKILATPEMKQKLFEQGMDPYISTPEQFATLIRNEMAKFAKVIKAANIKL